MSKEVFIVAGGPSLKGFNWSRLNGKDVIAINRSYEVIPNAKYIYFADWDFFEKHKEAILNHGGQILTGYASNICRKRIEHPDVTEYTLTGADGFETKPNSIRHGRNGGYAAINVAYHLGYKRIYLLGYDMGRNGEETHWHNGHPRIDPPSIYTTMLNHYDTMDKALKNVDIEIFNLNPKSKLKVFPFLSVADALGDKEPCEKIQLDV